MLKKSFVTLFASVLLLACLATTSCSLFRKGDQARVNYLLVTGNYLEPRLICELIQDRTKQPVLIYDKSVGTTGQMVFFSGNKKASTVTIEEYSEFLDFLNPKKVVFVGPKNDLFYPTQLVEKTKTKNFTPIVLDDANWENNCQVLADILSYYRLPREYSDLMKSIKAVEESQDKAQK